MARWPLPGCAGAGGTGGFDMTGRRSQEVLAELDHPVIDVDGHVLEFMPAVLPYVREALGAAAFERYERGVSPIARILGADPASRIATGTPQSAWWGTPSDDARDLAMAVFPQLLHERMDELGIDYSVLYPTKGFRSEEHTSELQS